MAARSSPIAAEGRASVSAGASISSASRTVTSGRSSSAAFSSSIIAASLMTIFAPQSLTIWRICCAFSNAFTGTKTPDAMLTPKIDQHSSMPRGR